MGVMNIFGFLKETLGSKLRSDTRASGNWPSLAEQIERRGLEKIASEANRTWSMPRTAYSTECLRGRPYFLANGERSTFKN